MKKWEHFVCLSAYSAASEEYTGKEKLVISEDVELVTLVNIIKGRLEVTSTHVYFFDCSLNKEEGKMLFLLLTMSIMLY